MIFRSSHLPFLLLISGITAKSGAQTPTLTKPDIHGDEVVFTAEGDLWVGSIQTGAARRLTSDRGVETNAKFSPDGLSIAYTAQYDGTTEVYIIPAAGGVPKRLTYDSTRAEVQGWTPDGNRVLYRSWRNSPVGRVRHLWSVPRNGGLSVQLPIPSVEFASFGPGNQVAYVPVSNEWANWFRYQAGATDEIWSTDLKGNFRKLVSLKGIATTPTWCKGDIFFVAETTGSMNLHRYDVKLGKETPLTHFKEAVRYPSSDGKRVVFQLGAGIGIYDSANGAAKPVSFTFTSDFVATRPRRVSVESSRETGSIGPTGKRIAIIARGQLLTVPAVSGDMRIVDATPGARASLPVWSPDGKSIAYVSDRSGENQVWVAPSSGGEPKMLTTLPHFNATAMVWAPGGKSLALTDRDGRYFWIDAAKGDHKLIHQHSGSASYDSYPPSLEFNPGGRLLAFQSVVDNWQQCIFVYDSETGKKFQVTSSMINAKNPSFTPDGKFLVYLGETNVVPSESSFNNKLAFLNPCRVYAVALDPSTPSPFLPKVDDEADTKPKSEAKPKIDLEGISTRTIEVPIPATNYSDLTAVAGKLALIRVATPSDSSESATPELILYDFETKKVTSVGPGLAVREKTPDGKKLLLTSVRGHAVYDIGGAPVPVPLAGLTITLEPKSEWKQILRETWRIARDFFYDPGLHGVDWEAVWRKYEPRLAQVGDRTDLARLQKDMVSELNCGHAYVTDPTGGIPPVSMGYLGADYEAVPNSPAVKIKRLLRGDDFSVGLRSPLLEPGVNVKEGDYIIGVSGQPLNADQDIQARFVAQAGQIISLTVNSTPSAIGARTIQVRLLGSEDQLRYQDWVLSRRKYVEAKGGPDLGFVHIPDMTEAGMVNFTKAQLGNVYKNGMVYDTRFNGGGYISSLLLEVIRAKPQAWWQPRNGNFWTREGWANIGYSVAICNEHNFSDGELFVEIWKKMKLGPVVGKRTGGGEVGSGGGYRLVDGGSVYIPNYASFADGKWLIEGFGATPTHEVDQDPAAVLRGEDPQLDKAIQLLLEELKKNPITRPVRPPFPKKDK